MNYKYIQDRIIDVSMYDTIKLFTEDVPIEDFMDYDFDYLPETHQLVLAKLLLRSPEVPMTFHPDIIFSLMNDKEGSPYYKKTPHEIESIYRKESTKSTTQNREARIMSNPVDETSQKVRDKKYRLINMLVKQGYDRAYCMDELKEYTKVNGTGVLNLTSKRIAAIIDAELQKKIKIK